jgi:hypothetical protein
VKSKGQGRGTNEDSELPTTRTQSRADGTTAVVEKNTKDNDYIGEVEVSKKGKKKKAVVSEEDAVLEAGVTGAAGVKAKVAELVAERAAVKDKSKIGKNGKEEKNDEKARRKSRRKRQEVDIPSSHAALLESIAQGDGKGTRTGIRGKKVSISTGLEELHRALHLSKYEGVDDRSKVIQAEPLEMRKQRMLEKEQEKRRTKGGRPGKKDAISKTLQELKNKQKRDAEASNEKNKVGSSEETEIIDNEKETSSSRQSSLRRSKRLKTVDTDANKSVHENGNIRNKLADKELDAEGWSLKEIVRWGNARERKMAKNDKGKEERAMERNDAVEEDKEPKSFAPQVKVKDGKVVVNRESLTVAAQQKEEYTRVVNEEVPRLNSMSYVNRLSNDRWSVEDTELFFRVCSTWGYRIHLHFFWIWSVQ